MTQRNTETNRAAAGGVRGFGPGGGPGRGMGGGERAKDFRGIWKKLLNFAGEYRVAMLVAVVCAALGSLLALMGPGRISQITDLIAVGPPGGIDLDAVFRIGLTLAGIYLLSVGLSATQAFLMTTVTEKISRKLRSNISQKINRLPVSYFGHTLTGDILSRVTNDVDTVGQSMGQSLGMLASAAALLAGSLFMMTMTNLLMTLTAVLASLLGFVLMMAIMKKSQSFFVRQQKHLGALNGNIEEMYTGHTVIQAYNAQEQTIRVFEDLNRSLKDSGFKAQSLSGIMMPLMGFIGNMGYVAVCVVGALLTMNGSISFGVIVAFILYVRLFAQPLSQIAQASQRMQSGAAAGERVLEFLKAPEMTDEGNKQETLGEIEGYVDFEQVQFTYEGSAKPVIKGFSANVKPGQKIAIVGPTGAGKTTIVNLLMRFYEVDAGNICIDGVPIADLTREEARQQFCMVLQDTWTFEGTIRENMAFNTPY